MTYKEVFKTLPFPVGVAALRETRDQGIAHEDNEVPEELQPYVDQEAALLNAFDWNKSPQGYEYWCAVAVHYNSGEGELPAYPWTKAPLDPYERTALNDPAVAEACIAARTAIHPFKKRRRRIG